MSESHVIQWFDSLLFGGGYSCPPPELGPLVLKLESEGIPWSHFMETDGLVEFAHDVHGDLNTLIDHLQWQKIHDEEEQKPRAFKTRAVTRFWDEFRLLTARSEPAPAPLPTQSDDETLTQMLEGDCSAPLHFESAEFWGDVARRFIRVRRKMETPSPRPCPEWSKRFLELYHITCQARGHYLDPFNLHLVPHAEFVDAVHWCTPDALIAFIHDRPRHRLSQCVRRLLDRTVQQMLRAEPLPLPSEHLDAFRYNVRKMDGHVEAVNDEPVPPMVIDVLQRLLALVQLDYLWEKEVPAAESEPSLAGTTLMYLTEKLQMAERERKILLSRSSESCPARPERTCPLPDGRSRRSGGGACSGRAPRISRG